ncbi:hypothetical protein QR680_014196 [Steinernema hermaphroditum]|uniref:Galactosylgalactosylxylosylprotein 3-beta-glucuronosyltransferase n=1 Tax=Steinernema hermaphroditum TaxID=289476 RepID=A0AA39I9E7_9BILA|nr:hypothetical protein QR680_014196 [Steinernema hermaphroditum]
MITLPTSELWRTIVAGTLRGLRCEMAIGGQSTNLSTKVIIAIALFFACQLLLLWSNFEDLDEKKASVEAAVARLERRKDVLQKKIMDLERESYRINKTLLRSEILLKDRLPLLKNSRDLPPIFFITPTHYRPAQKADLTRLAQTLKSVPNLVWIVVEDADRVSEGVAAVIKSSGLQYGHLHAQTPSHLKLNASDPNWKVPRGVMQRNQALSWIRTNFAASTRGVVYFGDDDNTYDWRLFNEMRSIRNVGVWPVGIVGGQLVETPLVSAENGSVIGFSAKWKPDRPFPIDMAAFAVNVSLLHSHPKTEFSYDVPRGYQESTFLVGLNLARFDLEPKAVNCTRVYDPVKMGERKGQNHYYPPDFDYRVHKNLNRYHGTHALRERARKMGEGILIIRFEMPFNIWCLGCENHVGMGVRYNAEKKKIGMYHSTPLYEFRMKCHLCDNHYIIRTDPKNFDYELVEGCRRQEKRFDPSEIDNLAPVDRTFNQQLNSNAMFKVEHQQQDEKKSVSAEDQMAKLEFIQDRMRDDFAANQALRRGFRQEKQHRKELKADEDAVLAKTSLQIKLLPVDPSDKKLAKHMLTAKASTSHEEHQKEKREQIAESSIFAKSKKAGSSDIPRVALARQLKRSSVPDSFALTDPSSSTPWPKKPTLTMSSLGIVPKAATNPTSPPQAAEEASPSLPASLVAYGSSSDSD